MSQGSRKSTKLRRGLFALIALLFGIAGLSALPRQNQSDWQTVAIDDLFSFRLPTGFVKRSGETTGERSEYYQGKTKLAFIWGHTESPAYNNRRQSWMNDYQETTTRLGGKRANIRTYSKTTKGKRTFHAELNVGNWEKGEVQLYMRMEGTELTTIDLAQQIFKSVTFPIPAPERP